MKNVYLEAAKQLSIEDDGCCDIIKEISNDSFVFLSYFAHWFRPTDLRMGEFWWDQPQEGMFSYIEDLDPDRQLQRELALLFMHEISQEKS